ncbi:oligosaccharide repeat unit polymerase [Photobacterium sp. Hal280]|uniref:oligosaccharide repeat unit polymerase n=1 Tax=Photobacterium sp. Hal280 TaxID=3035163 RepID=UPI00301B7EA1
MNKLKVFTLYIYMIPTFISLLIIFNNGYLLGDFRNYLYSASFFDIAQVFFLYSCMLLVIYLFIISGSRIHFFSEKNKQFEKYSLLVFCFILFITLAFGAVKIGQPVEGGLTGLMIKLASKFNPLLLVLIISYSNISVRKFAFCILVTLIYGFKQQSLQGYLISFIAVMIYALKAKEIKSFYFYFLLLSPIIFGKWVLDFVTWIYTLRNELRGVEFDTNEILSLAVGRISSISSYIYLTENHFSYNKISEYFSHSIFISRIIGVQMGGGVSPSDIFNQELLGGNAGYSIFLGLLGMLDMLIKGDILVAANNVIFLLMMLFISFQMIPYFNKKERVLMFFSVFYLPFLSSDIWEWSILLQSLIVIQLGYLIFDFCSKGLRR